MGKRHASLARGICITADATVSRLVSGRLAISGHEKSPKPGAAASRFVIDGPLRRLLPQAHDSPLKSPTDDPTPFLGSRVLRIGKCPVLMNRVLHPGSGEPLQMPNQIDNLADFDYADFAQEFLRRNPAYQDQLQRAGIWREHEPIPKAHRSLAQRWGLEFPYFRKR